MEHIFKILLTVGIIAVGVTAMFDGEPKEVKCKGEVIKNMGTFHMNMKDCMGEFLKAKAENSPDRKKGLSCLVLCALTKDGLFDAKGTYNEGKMNSIVDTTLSGPKAAMLKEETAACVKSFPGLMVVPEDKICSNYKPLFRCFRKAWMKTCVEGYDADVMEEDS